ncbi:hypothetical protein HMPREF9343_01039 [Cutibacterium acnes HL099PA1]|nr:hypothetical protein HMPREF9343_01039 [Cutibacterium acnes HL099PA1]
MEGLRTVMMGFPLVRLKLSAMLIVFDLMCGSSPSSEGPHCVVVGL